MFIGSLSTGSGSPILCVTYLAFQVKGAYPDLPKLPPPTTISFPASQLKSTIELLNLGTSPVSVGCVLIPVDATEAATAKSVKTKPSAVPSKPQLRKQRPVAGPPPPNVPPPPPPGLAPGPPPPMSQAPPPPHPSPRKPSPRNMQQEEPASVTTAAQPAASNDTSDSRERTSSVDVTQPSVDSGHTDVQDDATPLQPLSSGEENTAADITSEETSAPEQQQPAESETDTTNGDEQTEPVPETISTVTPAADVSTEPISTDQTDNVQVSADDDTADVAVNTESDVVVEPPATISAPADTTAATLQEPPLSDIASSDTAAPAADEVPVAMIVADQESPAADIEPAVVSSDHDDTAPEAGIVPGSEPGPDAPVSDTAEPESTAPEQPDTTDTAPAAVTVVAPSSDTVAEEPSDSNQTGDDTAEPVASVDDPVVTTTEVDDDLVVISPAVLASPHSSLAPVPSNDESPLPSTPSSCDSVIYHGDVISPTSTSVPEAVGSPLASSGPVPVTSPDSPVAAGVTPNSTDTFPEMNVIPASPTTRENRRASRLHNTEAVSLTARSASFSGPAHQQQPQPGLLGSTRSSVVFVPRFSVRPIRNIAPPTLPDIPMRKSVETMSSAERKPSLESHSSHQPRPISPSTSPRQMMQEQQLPPELLLHKQAGVQLPKSVTLQQRAAYEILMKLAQLREWMEMVLRTKFAETFNFLTVLRDGSVLVQLLCCLFPEYQPPQYRNPSLPDCAQRSILWLVRQLKLLGLRQTFRVEDLYEFKDIIGVVECLIEFALMCSRKGRPGLKPLKSTVAPSGDTLKWMSELIRGTV